jgi:hypothetical protein
MGLRVLLVVVVVGAFVAVAGCEPPPKSLASGTSPPPPPGSGTDRATGVEFAEIPVASEPGDQREPALPNAEPMPESPIATDDQPVIDQRRAPSPGNIPRTESPTAPAPATPQTPIRLSAGVALPQLLPEGTQIGVSVDYRLTGRLNPSSQYALVIESGAGTIGVPVELSPQGGTIQGFCPASVRPEHKPFNARIVELVPGSRSQTPISNTAALTTSY